MALGRQPEEFTVRQAARGDGVVGVDVPQTSGAPMGQGTRDIADERQANQRRQRMALHHRAEEPCPRELLGMGLFPFARRDARTPPGRGPVPPDEERHVRREAVGVGRKRWHLDRPRPHLSLGMVAPSQEQRAGPRDGLPALEQRGVDEFDAPAFPLHRGINPHRFEQDRAQQIDRQAGGLKLGINPGSLYAERQQTADVLASQRRAPRSSRHRPRQVGVAVESEERLGHDGGILDRHRYHDRAGEE